MLGKACMVCKAKQPPKIQKGNQEVRERAFTTNLPPVMF